MKREKIIRLVVSDDEKARLQAAADAKSLKLAVYVRMVALEAARKEREDG